MMEQPLVSIYVLCYNNYEKVEKTLESISLQSYENIELIISDDGTPNIPDHYFDRYLLKHKNRFANIIVNYNDKNMGTVRHINKVIGLSRGEVLCGIAGDDYFYDSGVVSDIVDYFRTTKELICTSKRVTYLDNKRQIIYPNKKAIEIIKRGSNKLLNVMGRDGNQISGAGTFYRRELFERYGLFSESFFLLEDYSYYMELLLRGVHIGFLDRITLVYGTGGISSGKKSKRLLEDSLNINYEIVYPNIDKFDFFTRRTITFKYKINHQNNIRKKIVICMKYIDVCIYRLIIESRVYYNDMKRR